MLITWLSFVPIRGGGNEAVSEIASTRYRILLPARALRARGHEVVVLSLWDVISGASPRVVPTSDILVVGKLIADVSGHGGAHRHLVLGMVSEAARRGTKLVADISDDHFDDNYFLDFYARLVRMNAEIVVASDVLARTAAGHLRCDVTVIGDPFEGPAGIGRALAQPSTRGASRGLFRGKSTVESAPPLRLVWFGHETNIPEITALVPGLAKLARQRRIELRLLTAASKRLNYYCDTVNSVTDGRLSVVCEKWSAQGLWSALDSCVAVLLPTGNGVNVNKLARSANRLIEALRAGRFAIAGPVSSYLEFGEYAWIGEDLCQGIQWAVTHDEQVLDKIHRGQAYVAAHYSPEAIAESWEAVYETAKVPIVDLEFVATGMTSVKPKLHLGCGDKLLEGYVNVDAVRRNEVTPDVICDVRDLNIFPADYAEEILSVHVVEHFYRWEAEELLREWLRVLSPGGRMVIECPNLVTACERYIDAIRKNLSPEAEPQTTMWVLYGDPGWRDPLMIHRWGYSPGCLAELMRSIGLTNIRQEPAQYKLKDPRDMRVVGEKPLK